MRFRKFATLILFAVLFIGFVKNSVYVAAEETQAATAGAVSSTGSKEKSTKSKEKKYTNEELRLMASIISCEAEGESYQGKLAVGIVVMNRVHSKQFPNTVRKVIYQKGQFSPVRNGAMKRKLAQYDAGKTKDGAWQDCIRAAKNVLSGQDYITYRGNKKSMKGYYFFSVHLSKPRFRLGGHRFK